MNGFMDREQYQRYYNWKLYALDKYLKEAIKSEGIIGESSIRVMDMLIDLGAIELYRDICANMKKDYKKEHRENLLFSRDRRASSPCISWVHALMPPQSMEFMVEREAHKIKRVEGNYEGVSNVPSGYGHGVMRKCSTYGDYKQYIPMIASRMQVVSSGVTEDEIAERIALGDMLVYSVTLKGSWVVNNIGCVVVVRDNGMIESGIVLNKDSLARDHINFRAALDEIHKSIDEAFSVVTDIMIIHNVL